MLTVSSTLLSLKILLLILQVKLEQTPDATPQLRSAIELVVTKTNTFISEQEANPQPIAPTQVQIVGSIPLQASTSPVETPKVVTLVIPRQPVISWNNTVSKQFGVAGEIKYVQVTIAVRYFVDGVQQFSTTGSDITATVNGKTVKALGKSMYNDYNTLTFPLYENGSYDVVITSEGNTKTETVVIDEI